MTAAAFAPPVRPGATLTRVIVAASLGNALEWFEFLVYGYFAVTISKVFFPSANETASLLATPGTFSGSSPGRRGHSGADRRQVPAGGIVEDAPVAGHQCGVRDARRRDDQPVGWIAVEYLR